MEESEADRELARRCEALYDRIVRNVEEARFDSWHAMFAKALDDFVIFIDAPYTCDDQVKYSESLMNKLLPVATYGVKLHRELLVISDASKVIEVDPFDVSHEQTASLRLRIDEYISALVNKAMSENDPWGERANMLGDDIADFYGDVIPGLRLWQLGTPEGMFEASCHWNIMPWHWTGHLLQAISTLNTLKYVERHYG